MANFDITDLISKGIESGVQADQFNRDLTARQRASEQLAEFRDESLRVQLSQLAESRRSAEVREGLDRLGIETRAETAATREKGLTTRLETTRTSSQAQIEQRESNERIALIYQRGGVPTPPQFGTLDYSSMLDEEIDDFEEAFKQTKEFVYRNNRLVVDFDTKIPLRETSPRARRELAAILAERIKRKRTRPKTTVFSSSMNPTPRQR